MKQSKVTWKVPSAWKGQGPNGSKVQRAQRGMLWHLQEDLLLFLGAPEPRGAPDPGIRHREMISDAGSVILAARASSSCPVLPSLSQGSWSVLCGIGTGKLLNVSACPECWFYPGWGRFYLLLAQTDTWAHSWCSSTGFMEQVPDHGEVWWQCRAGDIRETSACVPGAFPGSQALKMVRVF